MTQDDFLHLLPLLWLTGATIFTMLVIAIKRNHKLIYVASALSLAGSFLYLFLNRDPAPYAIKPLFLVDGFAIFMWGLILLTALAVSMLSYAYFEQREERKEEYYVLLLLATLGSCVLVISTHFVALFLGLEMLSIPLYALISYLRTRERSDEAGIKYLILAAFSSAFLLFGMALVYAATGSMSFAGVGEAVGKMAQTPMLVLAGFGLMVVGIGFKLGIVPFHLWTPDVYEGAPTPVAAFIATASKGGMVVALIRLFTEAQGYAHQTLVLVFAIIAGASMCVGNLLALMQQNIKRLLAYSSIAHLGYVLVAFLAGDGLGVEAVCFYLSTYFVTSLAAFGIVTMLSDQERDAERLEDYRGLLWLRPWTGALFAASLLSLAGIPLTAGFVGKFYIIAAGIHTRQWWLLALLVLNSVIGLFYYIRIVAVLFARPYSEQEPIQISALKPLVYLVSTVTLAVLAVLLVVLGTFPAFLMDTIQSLISTVR